MASTTFITAVESFAFVAPTGPINIRKGETFHKDAKRLEHCPQEAVEKNFRPFVPNHDVETATAAPGERRKVRRTKASEEKENEAGQKADETSADESKASDEKTTE